MRIAIGIPISRLFDWRTNLAQIYAAMEVRARGHDLEFLTEGNHERPMPIVEARNRIAQRAMEHDCDYLLWLDSDATTCAGLIGRLLDRDVPIVSALCFKRKYPVTPACGRKNPDPDAPYMSHPSPIDDVFAWVQSHDGLANQTGSVLLPDEPGALMPVDVVGTHFTLIKREVFERLPEPWYKRTTEPNCGSTGSDWYFCQQAREAGFPVYMDLTAISGHLEGSHVISVHDFVAWTIVFRYSEHVRQIEERKHGTDRKRS